MLKEDTFREHIMGHTKPQNRKDSQDALRHEKNREEHPGKKIPGHAKVPPMGKK